MTRLSGSPMLKLSIRFLKVVNEFVHKVNKRGFVTSNLFHSWKMCGFLPWTAPIVFGMHVQSSPNHTQNYPCFKFSWFRCDVMSTTTTSIFYHPKTKKTVLLFGSSVVPRKLLFPFEWIKSAPEHVLCWGIVVQEKLISICMNFSEKTLWADDAEGKMLWESWSFSSLCSWLLHTRLRARHQRRTDE